MMYVTAAVMLNGKVAVGEVRWGMGTLMASSKVAKAHTHMSAEGGGGTVISLALLLSESALLIRLK